MGEQFERRKRIGELLVTRGLASRQAVDEALASQVVVGGRLGTVLVELEQVSIEDLGRTLAEQHGVPEATARCFDEVTAEARMTLPAALCQERMVVPLRLDGDALELAMRDPGDTALIEELDHRVERSIAPRVAAELRLYYYLERIYGAGRPARFLRAPAAGGVRRHERRSFLQPTHGDLLLVAPDAEQQPCRPPSERSAFAWTPVDADADPDPAAEIDADADPDPAAEIDVDVELDLDGEPPAVTAGVTPPDDPASAALDIELAPGDPLSLDAPAPIPGAAEELLLKTGGAEPPHGAAALDIELDTADDAAIDLDTADDAAIALDTADDAAIDLDAADDAAIALDTADDAAIDLDTADDAAIDLDTADDAAIDLDTVDDAAIALDTADDAAIDLDAADDAAIDLDTVDDAAIDLDTVDDAAIALDTVDDAAIDLGSAPTGTGVAATEFGSGEVEIDLEPGPALNLSTAADAEAVRVDSGAADEATALEHTAHGAAALEIDLPAVDDGTLEPPMVCANCETSYRPPPQLLWAPCPACVDAGPPSWPVPPAALERPTRSDRGDAPPSAPLGTVAEMLASATDRAQIVDALVGPLRPEIAVRLLLLVREQTAIGLAAGGTALDGTAVQALVIPLNVPSLLQRAARRRETLRDATPDRLARMLSTYLQAPPAAERCAIPVTVGERVANLLYLEASSPLEQAAFDGLSQLGPLAGAAYQRLMRSRGSPAG